MDEKILKKLQSYKTTIEFSLSLIIFIVLYAHGQILKEFTFFGVLAAFLSFIILVEVIRMLGQYLVTNHISVTLMVDMVIIFFCRDILLTISSKTLNLSEKAGFISLFLLVLFCFFYFRGKALKHSKTKEEVDTCKTCELKEN